MTRAPARRLAEVATKVGVSEATVSRVLNGKPGVAEGTRAAILTALDVLGYERPTQLRGERARLIGLVLPELQNPIFPALAEVVGGALAQRGFTPVLCTRTAGGGGGALFGGGGGRGGGPRLVGGGGRGRVRGGGGRGGGGGGGAGRGGGGGPGGFRGGGAAAPWWGGAPAPPLSTVRQPIEAM